MHAKRLFIVTAVLLFTACGIVGPNVDFYDPTIASHDNAAASISGSKTIGINSLSPILVIVDSIDKKATGRAKAQRCNFDTPYPITSGSHEFLVAVIVGEPFAASRFGVASIRIDAKPKSKLVLRGEAYSADLAAIWIADDSGNPVSEKTKITLKDSPSKGVPVGFAALENSCSFL